MSKTWTPKSSSNTSKAGKVWGEDVKPAASILDAAEQEATRLAKAEFHR